MIFLTFLFLNIFFIMALYHMNMNADFSRMGKKVTRGVFKITGEQAYRYSEYCLIAILMFIDVLFVFTNKLFF